MTTKRPHELEPGDRVGSSDGKLWYTVREQPYAQGDSTIVPVTYPDGGPGERVFDDPVSLHVIEEGDQ